MSEEEIAELERKAAEAGGALTVPFAHTPSAFTSSLLLSPLQEHDRDVHVEQVPHAHSASLRNQHICSWRVSSKSTRTYFSKDDLGKEMQLLAWKHEGEESGNGIRGEDSVEDRSGDRGSSRGEASSSGGQQHGRQPTADRQGNAGMSIGVGMGRNRCELKV